MLGNNITGGPIGSKYTFLAVARSGFNINIPNANSSIRLGFCRGFEKIGIRYKIISVYNIEEEIENADNPILFLSVYDYLDMKRHVRRKLRNYYHFVWGSPDYDFMKMVYDKMNFQYTDMVEKNIYRIVGDSNPSFIWAPVPPSGLEFYSEWIKHRNRIVSIPLACDTERYFPDGKIDFENMKDMVFVGGYWAKKAIQFDKYLKPMEDKLDVYGYSEWPYKGYKGELPEEEERILYASYKISPALSEPHAEFIGDIVERPYKIMGCGGLALPDVNRFYSELFSPDELFVPKNIKEYYEFVEQALNDKDFNMNFRKKGYEAVIKKHTYKNRAEQILRLLNIEWPPSNAFSK